MRPGESKICGESHYVQRPDEHGVTSGRTVRCNTQIQKQTKNLEICIGCGREKGKGHLGEECVSRGIRFTQVARIGYFCERGYPAPIVE